MRGESSAEFASAIARRFKAQWRLKLALGMGMNVVFWSIYLFLSRHAFLPMHKLPLTPLDEWAGFHPGGWVWAYESAFLLSCVVPWLIDTREDIWRYVRGFAGLCTISFIIFALFPVASPRPIELSAYPTTVFLTRWDGLLNAFPSLHAGCLVYVLVTVWKLFSGSCPTGVKLILFVWAALILYATLTIKQHYAIDLLAGGLIGWAAGAFAWSGLRQGAIASASTRRNSGVTPQAGCR